MRRYRFCDRCTVKVFVVAGHSVALTPADAEYLRDRLNDALEEYDHVTPGEAAYNTFHVGGRFGFDWEAENGTHRRRWEDAARAAHLVAKAGEESND